jgi:hypothetical protein
MFEAIGAGRGFGYGPTNMAADSTSIVWVQLATRIPKDLHRRAKLHCIETDRSLTEFIVEALEDKMRRNAGGRKSARKAPSSA